MSDSKQAHTAQDLTMLVLNTAPELEEDLIDYLLGFEQVQGFTSYQVHGHGEHNGLSVAEQVAGRRKRAQYEIFIASAAIADILAGLRSAVGKDIVHWEQPLRNFGHID